MPKVKPPAVDPTPAEDKTGDDTVFLLTDGCMWEQNKQNGTSFPHSIEVVNIETGAVHFIRSGAKISLIEGDITVGRDQDLYNKI